MATYRAYLRSHGQGEQGRILERIEPTRDAAIAEAAYRRFLARHDLIGEPVAAVLSSNLPTGGGSGTSIYFSRFDRDFGEGRIHPDAPLDMFAVQDMTREATRWTPEAPEPGTAIDYETAYPDDFPGALKDFALRLNDGRLYGARPHAAEALRIPLKWLNNWIDGNRCPYEPSMRRLMTLIAEKSLTSKSP